MTAHTKKIICYGTRQASFLKNELGVPADKIELVLHPVDARFWRPTRSETRKRIVSAGMLYRDYETLIKAVDGLDVEVRIAAASPWVYTEQSVSGFELPDNVEFVKCNSVEMRQLYDSAQIVAVPLLPATTQAGSLVLYEAMAMGKPIVTTANGGNADIVRDGETGIYVPPMDVESVHGSRLPVVAEATPGSFPLIFTTAERGIGPPLESLRRFSEPRPAGTTLRGPCGANSSSASILPREVRF